MGKTMTTGLERMKELKDDLVRFMMRYKFALAEINTKIEILKQEFQYSDDYNPIEHVNSRLKSPDSILRKAYRKGCAASLQSIRENIRDIAGVRITCSFISDVYKVKDMLERQRDIQLVECKDYISNPKPNGYRSLHLIVKVPVFMSDSEDDVFVEIQIRTIAMDFWASLEHKIYYKYSGDIPDFLKKELTTAALSARHLDEKMENIHDQVNQIKQSATLEDDLEELFVSDERFHLPPDFLNKMNHQE